MEPLNPPPEGTPFVNADGSNSRIWLGHFRSIFLLLGGSLGAMSVARGGTGATDSKAARAALGIPAKPSDIKAVPVGDVNAKGQVINSHLVAALPIAQGGTGGTDAATARANLGVSALTLLTGSGTPNGFVVASPGALYVSSTGGAGVTLYVKESGVGTNTGWVGK